MRRLLPLFLPVCALIAAVSSSFGADRHSLPASLLAAGSSFAYADFDGDQRPDLARIEGGETSSDAGSYWIQLQLSAAGRQTIHLVAPPGGLLIEARDVNGDHAVDLVLTTAWFRQPVAVFLNDGHGGFSRAEPTAFPAAFPSAGKDLDSGVNREIGSVGAPPQLRRSLSPEGKRVWRGRPATPALAVPDSGCFLSLFPVPDEGRAPPFEPPNS